MKLEKYGEDPKKMKVIKWIAYIILILVVLFEIVVHLSGHESTHLFGNVWVFWSLFGFVCCVLMILIVKGIGHAFLMKKEDYYD